MACCIVTNLIANNMQSQTGESVHRGDYSFERHTLVMSKIYTHEYLTEKVLQLIYDVNSVIHLKRGLYYDSFKAVNQNFRARHFF